MNEVIVTTSTNPRFELKQRAGAAAIALQCDYVVRGSMSIAQLQQSYAAKNILVIQRERIVLHTLGGELFFHPNMAELRLLQLKRGNSDHMVNAMALKSGMSVLDCTLGLGTDAIVASSVVGTTGRVYGLEAARLTAFITHMGLIEFLAGRNAATIQVETVDYNDFLTSLPENEFDVVFFDPMFRQPISASSQLKPLRCLADYRPLSIQALNEARRVAKKRVVIKEMRNSPEFIRLGITDIYGGRYSSVQYGVLDLQAGDEK